MDASRAAEVIDSVFGYSSTEHEEAEELAVQALLAWAWVERTGCKLVPASPPKMWGVLDQQGVRRGYGPTPFLAVLDAMQKEGKG